MRITSQPKSFGYYVRAGLFCSLAAGITSNSRICNGIMPAATRGFTGVLRYSVWFNLEILLDCSLFVGVTDSSSDFR